MPMHVPPTGTPDNMGCTATSVNDRSLENVNVKHVLQRLFCCHAQGYLKQTTFSYSAVFAQHCINLNSPKNAIRTHHSHNTQHTSGTRKKKVTCAPGAQMKRKWNQHNTRTQRYDGRTLMEQMETRGSTKSRRPHGSALRTTCHNCHDGQRQKG